MEQYFAGTFHLACPEITSGLLSPPVSASLVEGCSRPLPRGIDLSPVHMRPLFADSDVLKDVQEGLRIVIRCHLGEEVLGISVGVRERSGSSHAQLMKGQQFFSGSAEP